VGRVGPDEYSGPRGEASAGVAARIEGARALQIDRGTINRRSSPDDMGESDEARGLITAAVGRGIVTARGADRVRRVARTIADLAGVERVEEHHVAEAVGLRGEWRDD